MGTHLNCLDKLIKAYVVGRHFNSLNEMLDCGLIGVCAVIRSNMVKYFLCCSQRHSGFN